MFGRAASPGLVVIRLRAYAALENGCGQIAVVQLVARPRKRSQGVTPLPACSTKVA